MEGELGMRSSQTFDGNRAKKIYYFWNAARPPQVDNPTYVFAMYHVVKYVSAIAGLLNDGCCWQ